MTTLPSLATLTITGTLLATLAGCPGKGGYVRKGPAPAVTDLVAKLAKKREALAAFTGESVMDYWIGKDRAKGNVMVMGKPGAKVRFAALSPAGDNPIIEMACDGTNYVYLDVQNNCVLTGPCDRAAIAQFLRVALEPQDFVALALGNPPVLENATGTVMWDSNKGLDILDLSGPGGHQVIKIDSKGGHFDVVEVKLADTSNKLLWQVNNGDFTDKKDVNGATFRVPMKSKLASPQENADLQVEWKDRKFNKVLPDPSFVIVPPAGLPTCGAKAGSNPPAAPPAPAPAPAPAPGATGK